MTDQYEHSKPLPWPPPPPPGADELRNIALKATADYMYNHRYAGWDDAHWRGGYNDRFSKIAERFPTLRGAPGVRPWNPKKLDLWAAHIENPGPKPYPGSGAVQAAAFVLSLFQHETPWLCGPFSLACARTRWDNAHRRAFTGWLFDPDENDGFNPGRVSPMEVIESGGLDHPGKEPIELVMDAVKARVEDEQEREFLAAEGLRLGQVVEILSQFPQDKNLPWGLGKPHSYRGIYSQLALEPMKNTTVADTLASVKGAIGSTYEGWKGGDFPMTANTPVNVATEGSSDGEVVTRKMLDAMLAGEEFCMDVRVRKVMAKDE